MLLWTWWVPDLDCERACVDGDEDLGGEGLYVQG